MLKDKHIEGVGRVSDTGIAKIKFFKNYNNDYCA